MNKTKITIIGAMKTNQQRRTLNSNQDIKKANIKTKSLSMLPSRTSLGRRGFPSKNVRIQADSISNA